MPINLYRATVRIIKTRNKIGNCGLARAARTDESSELAGLNVKRDLAECGTVYGLHDLVCHGYRYCHHRLFLFAITIAVLFVVVIGSDQAVNGLIPFVDERDIIECDLAAHLIVAEVKRIGRILDFNRQVQVFKDAVKQSQGTLNVYLHVQQLSYGEEQSAL